MGKIADIIRKYYGAILDTYYYTDDELEKTAYKIPEEEIIELVERNLINKDIICGIIGNGIQKYFLTWKLTDQNIECICNIVNEISVKMKQNLAELKEN